MSKTYAFLFPGQGSQKVGMGRELADAFPVARQTFEEADDVLGFSLSSLCFDGPEDDLKLTANTQPALLACSVAFHRVLVGAADLSPEAVAGHSLGEYSAHVAAGTLDFATALRLVRRRGELMQQAVPAGVGAMAAIMGLEATALSAALEGVETEGDEVVALANLNSPHQQVIAGHAGAVERGVEAAKAAGARVAKMLPVSAPFHSPLMAPARAGLEPDLAAATFATPSLPVISNVDAVPVTDGAAARDALVRQIDGAVRWVDSIEYLTGQGVDTFVEVGVGKVLCGLGKRIDKSCSWKPSPVPEAVDAFVAELTA
ncbi:MAG: ACP S-malonyltransferase [Acidobacteriota bacterium]